MNWPIELTIVFVSCLIVIIQGILSYGRGFLVRWQLERDGNWPGLPFLGHGGMWGDFFAIGPIMGIVASYASRWPTWGWILSLVIGMAASAGMHAGYVKGENPGCHNEKGHLTAAGWIHLFYMGFAFAGIILFYFFSSSVSHVHLRWITALLAGHVVLGVVQPTWYMERRVTFLVILQVIIAWAVLGLGYWLHVR